MLGWFKKSLKPERFPASSYVDSLLFAAGFGQVNCPVFLNSNYTD